MTSQSINNSESYADLLHFIQYAPVAVAMFDKEMNYMACSQKWLADWWVQEKPISIPEVIGKNHYVLFDDVAPYWKSVHKRALKGAIEFNDSDEFVKANGEKEYLRWDVRPWRNENNEINGVILFTEFITDRKKNEQLVKSSQKKLSTLVENIPGMAYSCSGDQNRTIQFVSSASLELTGYSPEDFKKESTTNFTKLILPEDREYVWSTIERNLKKKKSFEVNYRIKTKSGTLKEIVERGQGVFDQNGQLLSVEGILLDVSHQKALESDLKKSRMNLVRAQDVANIGSWELDLSTKEMLWSDQLFKICGADQNEVSPSIEAAISFVHPSDRKKLETKLKGIDKKEFKKQTEFRIVRADGVVRFTQVRTELSKDGKTLLGTMQDITESKLAEVALKESEARNKALLKAIPDMIFTHQVDGTFLDFELPENASLNVSRAQVVGKDLTALFPKNIAKTLQKKFLAAYKTNNGQSLEFELIIDNDRKYFEARIVKHKLGQVLSIIRDVTKAKQDELNAAQSLKSFYTAFHISPIAVTISHLKNGELIDVNQRFADLVKLEREDIIGKTSLDLNFWKTEHSRKYFVNELTKKKRVYDYEAEIRVSDGSFKDVILSAEIITIEGESAILLMISDISVRKKNEKELLKLTEELTSSNHELRQFAYITSHNLRGPIVNIGALIKFLNKDDWNDPGNPVVIDKIEQSFNQLNSSLNDLIKLVAIRDQKYQADEKIYFGEVYKSVYNSIETQIKSSEATINTDFKVKAVMYKKPLLESILLNLLTNAIKYRKEEPLQIDITTDKDENGTIYLTVRDNGLGIDLEKNSKRIFGMYERFHENKEGKGLGLYIIKSQIESMGGKIELTSTPDVGSTFKVIFTNNSDRK